MKQGRTGKKAQNKITSTSSASSDRLSECTGRPLEYGHQVSSAPFAIIICRGWTQFSISFAHGAMEVLVGAEGLA